ncbi:hypothetical protein NP233_g6967 [Leucocoprinus birnbaumii]|uniref:Protein kinase domain-containing protein n=1 Tax=Leucocoprinus birnbaumii TaxID=56174 RepID=A0AAD5YT78_9AGAR|nr:hypothetical protein NP233_g6967 [Leucocoprinus birnbaumii]
MTDEPSSAGNVAGKGVKAHENQRVTKTEVGYFGYGDHADVYRGKLDGKKAAIKQLRGVNTNKIEIRDALRAGLRTQYDTEWRHLKHPNVCPIYLVVDDFGFLPALILEYYPKGSLIKYIENHPTSDEQRLRWVLDVAEGLAYLHSMNVHHGDLRCANIFVNNYLQAVVADYGIAQYFSTSDFTSAKSTGTVRWTGPEVISLPPDPNATPEMLDIFAFGMTMLEALSGKAPYDGKSDTGAIFAIAKSEPPKLPDSIESNEELKNLFTDCTRQKPTERPTAKQVVDRLRPIRGLLGLLVSLTCTKSFLLGGTPRRHRYRYPALTHVHVEVVSRNPTLFLHAFQTLDREKDLAGRLTKLTIWVHALNEVIHLEETPNTVEPSVRPKPSRKLRQLLARRTSDPITPHYSQQSPPLGAVYKYNMFMSVLSKLQNLSELVLVWRTDDGYNKTSPTTCSRLAIDTWSRVAPILRSLTIDMAMFNIYETLRIPQELYALEELHVRITLEKHGAFRSNAGRIFTDNLIPFINRLAPQLISFSLTSLCNLNLDPLFRGLEPTPHLRRLALLLAFQSVEIWSPAALQTFLKDHDTIKELDLRYGECCSPLVPNWQHWSTHDRVLVGEAFTGNNAFTFPHLETLTLGLRFKLTDNNLLGAYASRFSGSVTSLTLIGRSLQMDKIKIILRPFQKTLRTLSMFVQTLTPDVLLQIAVFLPALQDLTLHVERFESSSIEEDGFVQHIGDYRGERAFSQWQLKCIHIREFAYGKGDVPAWDIMRAIAEVVPNLVSWGI